MVALPEVVLQPGDSQVVRAAAIVVPPPPPPPPVTLDDVVGPACRGQSKGNVQCGGSDGLRQEIVFRAKYSGLIVGAKVSLRGGPKGYSGGTGGTLRFAFTDGSGQPVGSSGLIVPGNSPASGWTTYPEILAGCPVQKGQLYRLGIVNTDTDPGNWVSLNHLYNWDGAPPDGRRQPRFPTGDWDLLVNGTLDTRHSPVLQLRYADGNVQGMGYPGMIGGITTLPGADVSYGIIGGTRKVRSTWQNSEFTVIKSLYVGGLRCQTAAPIHVSLWGPAGELVDVVSPAIATSAPGGDSGGTAFVGGTFPALTVPPGAWQVRLSSTGLWSVAPIREGTEYGFDPRTCWPDGKFQVSNDGVSFTDPYAGLELQWYADRVLA